MLKDSEIRISRGNEVVDSPKVSIIIPAYNISEYIVETLESIFQQNYIDYEIIIINDGSPDTTKFEEVLSPYLSRIVYLKIPNVGAGAARNYGITNSRGELIAFLDGDDVWLNDYLASQVGFLEDNNLDLVYCDALLFGGSNLDNTNYMKTSISEGEADFESLLDLRCNVITSGTLAKKKNIVNVGMFEWEKVRAHDFILWLKIAQSGGKLGYQRKILLKYRVRLDSLSGDSVQRVQREIDVYHRVLNAFNLNQNHHQIIEKQLTRLEAEKELEKGKSYFIRKDFKSAVNSFGIANKYRKSLKLKLIIFLLNIAPNLTLKIYKSKRADEIAFIPPN